MATRKNKNIDPSANLRRDPADDYTEQEEKKTTTKKDDHLRFNIYVARENEPIYKDFKIYCNSLAMSVSELINVLIEREVNAHAAEIEAARERFAERQQRYGK